MANVIRLHLPKALGQLSSAPKNLMTSQGSLYLPTLSSHRSIVGKAFKDHSVKRKPPFPYKEKKFTLIHSIFDRTTHRFDENSKIIVVDGTVAAGKSAFAKELAEDLDMLYMPEANMDMIYINPAGYDMRKLDPKLPESVRSFDTRNFCLNPNHFNVAFLQMMLYQLKFGLYVDALAHIMNTGQGVVLDKSPYSDYVYIDALEKSGFISKTAQNVYYDVKRHTIDELMRPHLAIYLDLPVAKVLEKVKQRGRPEEKNSKALSEKFLADLEEGYKRRYLKEISNHAEILIYDWSDGGDVEVVVEDIERIDFNKYDEYDTMLSDWRLPKEQTWSDRRISYTEHKEELLNYFNVPRFDCPELIVDGEDFEKFSNVWDRSGAPGTIWEDGYDPEKDKGWLWRWKPKQKFSYYS